MQTKEGLKQVFYFGNYIDPDDIPERKPISALASTNKMRYIISKMSQDFQVTVVSPGFSTVAGYHKETIMKKNDFDIVYLSCKNGGATYINVRAVKYYLSQMEKFIKEKISKDAYIVIYSSPWNNLKILQVLKRNGIMTKNNTILEVEELYGYDKQIPILKKYIYRIVDYFSIVNIDKFIFVNELVEKRIRTINKKSIGTICYGEYRYDDDNSNNVTNSEVINLLYTGSIDNERGIFIFLNALKVFAERFPVYSKKTILKICGYFHGKSDRVIENRFFNAIESVSRSGVEVKFCGEVREEILEEMIKHSDICVAPQLINSGFSKYSFPSKILKYLSFGKTVLSSRMRAINESKLSNYLILYDNDSPTEIAAKLHEIIINTKRNEVLKKEELRNYIIDSDRRFKKELLLLLNDERKEP